MQISLQCLVLDLNKSATERPTIVLAARDLGESEHNITEPSSTYQIIKATVKNVFALKTKSPNAQKIGHLGSDLSPSPNTT